MASQQVSNRSQTGMPQKTDMPGMSMPGGMTMPTRPPGPEAPSVTVASYGEYADAQRAVDYLSDRGFPVQHTSIVGTGLRLVEQVTGRLTTGSAALSGAGGGAWLGLLIGLLLGLFAVDGWFAVVLSAVLIGAVWGAIFGAVAHSAMRGQRDFRSRSGLQATEFGLTVAAPYADQARELLAHLDGGGAR